MLESETFVSEPMEGLRLVLPLIHEVRQVGARKTLFQPRNPSEIKNITEELPSHIKGVRTNLARLYKKFPPNNEFSFLYDQLELLAEGAGHKDTLIAARQHAEHAAHSVLPSYYETGDQATRQRGESGFINVVCMAASWRIAEENPLLRNMKLANPFKILLWLHKQGAYDADTFSIGNKNLYVVSFLQRNRHGNRFTYWIEGQGASSFSPLDLPDLTKNPVYAPGTTSLRLVDKT